MKEVKLLFIALEVACIFGVIILAFTEVSEDGEFFKSMYISLLTLLSLVFERDQAQIEWEEEV